MEFPNSYKCLKVNVCELDEFKIAPIKFKDHKEIMNWRNDQIDILRQQQKLDINQQVNYFESVVARTFYEDNPKQLLFGYYRNDELIGYGGLVHIDWKNRNSEVSFLLDSKLNNIDNYTIFFGYFLDLISNIAKTLGLRKVYTVGYNLYDFRFNALKIKKFELEATLKKHILIKDEYVDVKIYSKIFVYD